MDPDPHSNQQEHMQQHQNVDNSGTTGGGGKGSNSFAYSRQSSTRWTPTPDQIRILKELYDNNGVRSPTTEQIQRITAWLRQYGKVEGKNVFYWFQNHKARDRIRKKFAFETDHLIPAASVQQPRIIKPSTAANNVNKYSSNNVTAPGNTLCSSSASSSCAGVVSGIQQMGSYRYGSSGNMEKNFRDCIRSCGGCGSLTPNKGRSGVGYSLKNESLQVRIEEPEQEDQQDQEYEENYNIQEPFRVGQDRETLPLFPEH